MARHLFVHDGVIKWKHFPRYWPSVRGIHRSPVNSPHTGQWRGALMFTLICARINGWVNNREAGDLRRHRAHSDVIVMRQDIHNHHEDVDRTSWSYTRHAGRYFFWKCNINIWITESRHIKSFLNRVTAGTTFLFAKEWKWFLIYTGNGSVSNITSLRWRPNVSLKEHNFKMLTMYLPYEMVLSWYRNTTAWNIWYIYIYMEYLTLSVGYGRRFT